MHGEIYKPGTPLVVGTHHVVIDKYFSKGGFAQVYTCSITPKWNGKSVACLKRVLVPDKPSLSTLRKEVDAMRKLQGIECIVSYIDSHAARSNDNSGGYEVFVLMEYCSNKGLIDFMNTRLVDKLKEFEILKIVQSITEAVCYMHVLKPPLIHRDIKIENVLISDNWVFKLCDFGSVSLPILPPKNAIEFRSIQDDIMKNTTPQYRAPEMIDLSKQQIIGEKADVWALGVFLYKLCYYITPFEQSSINQNVNGYHGDYAILHGIYKIPPQPLYSSRLINLIKKMLQVNQSLRPTALQVLTEICQMRGVNVPSIGSKNYNDLKKTLTNTTSIVTTAKLDSVTSHAPTRVRRPISMYDMGNTSGVMIASLNNKSGNEVHSTREGSIDSSLDYLKSISQSRSVSGPKSKRSSITSLKNLLTGESYKDKERSKETIAVEIPDSNSSTVKRSSSIQRRMKSLFKSAAGGTNNDYDNNDNNDVVDERKNSKIEFIGKKAPPKPPKPSFLRATSVTRDIKEFEKRFPSINPI
ncbi:hypothetical protein CANINC_003704 [Pichia inconspicua]|uniref:non-specific serine/threonine protein kinase n=1 Tax=Pichia inconspicua TaxID=52247 RepID=A0A4T0WYE1_9ASCO|nr:hypothetical protein CANINC_003704 [[Candida] inconspicua]